jgi:hypothetical protein
MRTSALVLEVVPATSGSKRTRRTHMADIRFSCAQCGQHISCDELWSGHQIQCPACQNSLMVPHIQPLSSATVSAPQPPAAQPPPPSRPKLAAGSTQVTRSNRPGPTAPKQRMVRPPKTENFLLKYTVIAVVLVVIGWTGYTYIPGLLTQVQEMGTSKTPAPTGTSTGSGGLLGEVNDAMDVSDTLDGSTPSKPRAGAAKRPVVNQPSATPATNSAAKSVNRRPR